MPACIDLRKAHIHRRHGDLLAVYTWIDSERALVLIPFQRQKSPWYVLKESAAYQYDDPEYLKQACMKACEVLGMSPTPSNWVRVATVLNEGLPDLYRMPSEPSWSRPVGREFGELIVKQGGQEIAREALTLPGDEGAEYA